jgi:hypothetical protein
MKPVELHVYDFDGALYDSPRLRQDRPDWWYSARSLQGWGPPGHDRKWILDTVYKARLSVRQPWTRTALLTGRPEHAEMTATIRCMLEGAGLRFDQTQFKPAWPPQKMEEYKALKVVDWLADHPTVSRVIYYDDLQENLDAVGAVVTDAGVRYLPCLTVGVS